MLKPIEGSNESGARDDHNNPETGSSKHSAIVTVEEFGDLFDPAKTNEKFDSYLRVLCEKYERDPTQLITAEELDASIRQWDIEDGIKVNDEDVLKRSA